MYGANSINRRAINKKIFLKRNRMRESVFGKRGVFHIQKHCYIQDLQTAGRVLIAIIVFL